VSVNVIPVLVKRGDDDGGDGQSIHVSCSIAPRSIRKLFYLRRIPQIHSVIDTIDFVGFCFEIDAAI
jgi:hypothetical protein